MNNREAMQKAFECQKFKVFSPFKCDITKNEGGNYVHDETIFAFAWFCRGLASQTAELSSNPLQLPTQAHQPDYKLNELAQIIMSDCGISTTNNDHLYDRILGRLIASSELQSQAQKDDYASHDTAAHHKWLKQVEAENAGKVNELVCDLSQAQQTENLITRKAFICPACEGVDADSPVSSCHCMENDSNTFIEGTITYRIPPAPEGGA